MLILKILLGNVWRPVWFRCDTVRACVVQEYLRAVSGMAAHGMNTLFVDFSHIMAFDEALAISVKEEYYR